MEGEDLFYRGELARALVAACADGGHLTAEDLDRYRVVRRGGASAAARGGITAAAVMDEP